MCWLCIHPDSSWDDYLDHMRQKVDEHGWAVQFVGGSRLHAPWAYTVGLTEYELPELVVTGITQQQVDLRLNGPAEGTIVQAPTVPGERRRFYDGVMSECVPLAQPLVHLKVAVDLYGDAVRGHQLVWQDDRGRWPWERGLRGRKGGQPVLGPRVRAGD